MKIEKIIHMLRRWNSESYISLEEFREIISTLEKLKTMIITDDSESWPVDNPEIKVIIYGDYIEKSSYVRELAKRGRLRGQHWRYLLDEGKV